MFEVWCEKQLLANVYAGASTSTQFVLVLFAVFIIAFTVRAIVGFAPLCLVALAHSTLAVSTALTLRPIVFAALSLQRSLIFLTQTALTPLSKIAREAAMGRNNHHM